MLNYCPLHVELLPTYIVIGAHQNLVGLFKKFNFLFIKVVHEFFKNVSIVFKLVVVKDVKISPSVNSFLFLETDT